MCVSIICKGARTWGVKITIFKRYFYLLRIFYDKRQLKKSKSKEIEKKEGKRKRVRKKENCNIYKRNQNKIQDIYK